ncbi:MAG TPA: cytochrome c oxidase subunit I [Acidimicrobiales bacterium]|jgi:cytochrome c oxidase subunit 1|nr:cytochrome c oxidase subunit I [Acidimicrobiales bacterium]
MTDIAVPESTTAAPAHEVEEPSILRRPAQPTGVVSWLTTIDHKRIGILYAATSIVFFLAGGLEALLIRVQLARPDGSILSASAYNQIFTMHGTTMIFLVVMPLSTAFFNYLVPLQIGARDVAFPRLNAFSYWTFLLGGLFMYSSFLLGGAPNGGWFGYAPNTSVTYNPGHNIDFWIFGLQILGIASTVGAVNFVTTILNLRAPGMTLFRMPIFTWMSLVANFLLLFAMPVITVALFLLMFDRNFGSHFFDPSAGGNPVLWQHLFWLFGHPEVYILVLPAMGMVSEIIPVFSRKPLFGYRVMVLSGIAIGFMGWGVWVHHMFSVGLGPVAVSAFSLSTMFIAVPTGVKIFNWLGTMQGGSLRFTTAMLFAIGFVAMFTIGGLSGVTHAVSPHDRQQTDTYYIVAHFHYVLFGGSLFGIMGGFYYWWPKVFGRMLSERIGKWHFWTWLIGFNLAFGPMHLLGLQGMPRRIYVYPKHMGWDLWNMVSTIGAFTIAVSTLLFVFNIAWSRKRGQAVGRDPWDGRALEWSISSPPPEYNFVEIPEVHSEDDWWHRKYTEDADGRLVRLKDPDAAAVEMYGPSAADPDAHHDVHMPSPSYFPLVSSIGLPIIAYGMVYGRDAGHNYVIAALGGVILLTGLFAWAMEPSTEPGDHGDHAGHDAEPVLVGAGGPAALEAGSAGSAPVASANGGDDDGERIPRDLLRGGDAAEEEK